jgi:hypothetical protein
VLREKPRHRLHSCPKNVSSEWDRYNSEVYVYGPGRQPFELDKKYRVDMRIYKKESQRMPSHNLTEAAK